MKKLVLVLSVLLLTGSAFAVPVIIAPEETTAGSTITVAFAADQVASFANDFELSVDNATNPSLNAAATTLSFLGTLTLNEAGNGFTVNGAQSFGFTDQFLYDNVLFEVTFTVPDVDSINYSATGYFNSEPTDISGSINVVPEPMTVALLGLGGLFLRRKK